MAEARQYDQGGPGAPGTPGTPAAHRAVYAASAQPPRLSGRNGYSIFVGWMKLVLPALAVALVLLVFIWPQFKLYEGRFRIRVSDISLEQADKLTMLNARYEGLDDKDQPYVLSADQAIQSSDNKDLIDLEMPKGDISLDDGAWLAMDANEGVYHRETELLDLAGNVTLFHDNGFELRSESARIDLEAGTAEGHETTEGQGPSGSSQSEGFLVLERGDVLVFTGKSRVVIRPKEEEPGEAGVAPAETAPAETAPAEATPAGAAPAGAAP